MKCPKCNTTMQIKDGMYGKFYSCPNYRLCKSKGVSLKKAKGLNKAKPSLKSNTTNALVVKKAPPKLDDLYRSVGGSQLHSEVLNKFKGTIMNPLHKQVCIEHLEWLIEQYTEEV